MNRIGVWATLASFCAAPVLGVMGCGGVTVPPDLVSSDAAPDTHVIAVDAALDNLVAQDTALPDVVQSDVVLQPDVVTTEAGVGACPVAVPPAPVCAGACGNGQIDTCPVCSNCGPGDGGNCCQPMAEPCDGADLGGATCASLGFSGGTLRCNAGCGFDLSGCDPCGNDPRIVACSSAPFDAAGATTLALAANGTAIALAWVTATTSAGPATSNPGAGGLHVAVLGPDLTVLQQTACIGSEDASRIAVAATPSGWIVAAERPAGVALYALAADGTLEGNEITLPGASVPILAAQPAGGPLLVWVAADGSAWATLLGVDGTVGATAPLFQDTVEPQFGSAVFVGDGFLVALRANDGSMVAHVGLDGEVGASHSLGQETEYPQIAWTGQEARVVYADFSGTGSMQIVALDATGAPLGSPATLGSIPTYYDPAPNVTSGADSVVLLPGYTGGTGVASHLDVGRFSSTGQTVYGPYAVALGGAGAGMSPYALAGRGQDVIAAWLSSGWWGGSKNVYPETISVARLTP